MDQNKKSRVDRARSEARKKRPKTNTDRAKSEPKGSNNKGAAILLVVIAVLFVFALLVLTLTERRENDDEEKWNAMRDRVNAHADTAYPDKWLGDADLSEMDAYAIEELLTGEMKQYMDRMCRIRINRFSYEYSMEDTGTVFQYVCREGNRDNIYPEGREDALAKHIVGLDKDLSLEDQDDILAGNRKPKSVHVEIQCLANSDEITKIVKKYSEKFDKPPKNATINADLKITPEKNGKVLDTAGIANDLKNYLSSNEKQDFEKSYHTSPVKAAIKASYLAQIDTSISSFSTVFIPNNTRGKNVKLAASRIDGRVLKPEERISFLEALYDDSDGKKYGDAGGFLNNKVVQVEGGGICQVSTTAYDAFLLAGIVPVERHPHTCKVSYAKPGLDAALAVGTKDLVIENTLDYPIMIRAKVRGSRLRVSIYSYRYAKKGYSYKARYETDEENSLVVTSYLDVYEDDKLLESRKLSVDTYKQVKR
ncbi:MAG: VanW family protein [Eubacterium sp.]|nr:VanW family protein [Eubacterium sp.]